MKYLIFLSIMFITASCWTPHNLLEKNTDDGGKFIVNKKYFSGINYLHLEKKVKGKLQYYILYDCECGVANKMHLRKVVKHGKEESLWTGVTDTIPPKIFDVPLIGSGLVTPLEFMPITQEEKSLLEEALSKVNEECCKIQGKPVKDVIGYVKMKVN